MTSFPIEQQLLDLAARLARVEDELAIHRLIVRYGFAVDAGDAEATMALFTEDAVFEVGAPGTGRDGARAKPMVMRGRAAVGEMVRSEAHQSLLPNAAHTIGPSVVAVDGESASAVGYSRIYHREGEAFRLFRAAVNHWELRKIEGRWLIRRRTSRVVGEPEMQDLLRRALG